MRSDNIASFIVNPNHRVMCTAVKLCAVDCIADRIRLATGSSDNPKRQLRRIVAFHYICLANPLERAPKSLTDARLRTCHICQHHPATQSPGCPRVNEASRHERVSTPYVDAWGELGDLVVRP